MTKEAMEGALKAINEEAEKLLPLLRTINEEAEKLLPEEFIEKIRKGLLLIMSISRYELDVRGSIDQKIED